MMSHIKIVLIIVISLFILLGLFVYTLAAQGPKAWPVEQISGSNFMQLDSGRVRYQDTRAEQEAILFLHGFNGQMSHWNSVWSELHDCSRLIRMDIPGFGESEWQEDSYTLGDQGKRIIEFLDSLGVEQVTLVGISMGGSLAAWLAAEYPKRVTAVTLIAPSGLTGSLTFGGRFKRFYEPGLANDIGVTISQSKFYKMFFPRSRVFHGLSVTSSYGEQWDRAIERIKQPTTILWSLSDRAVPFKFAGVVAKMIDNSLLIPLAEDVGHNVLKHRPKLVAKAACQMSKYKSAEKVYDEIESILKEQGDL